MVTIATGKSDLAKNIPNDPANRSTVPMLNTTLTPIPS